jgi:hypothetical protein
MIASAFPFHFESSAVIDAPPETAFAYLDDPTRLASHMESSSMMMLGSRMSFELDGARGQAVGSKIALVGSVLWIRLRVDEVVTERTPPVRKIWETVGEPRLLVIGSYRMGFEVQPVAGQSRLRVFIDDDLPPKPPSRWLGRVLGSAYARWCTEQMVKDAAARFPRSATHHPASG